MCSKEQINVTLTHLPASNLSVQKEPLPTSRTGKSHPDNKHTNKSKTQAKNKTKQKTNKRKHSGFVLDSGKGAMINIYNKTRQS